MINGHLPDVNSGVVIDKGVEFVCPTGTAEDGNTEKKNKNIFRSGIDKYCLQMKLGNVNENNPYSPCGFNFS